MSDTIISRLGADGSTEGFIAAVIDDPDFPGELIAAWVDPADLSLGGGSALNWLGAWNSGTAYVVDDMVSRNGSSYIAILAGTNHAPESSPTYWDLIAAKGDTGSTGATGSAGTPGSTGATGATGASVFAGSKAGTLATAVGLNRFYNDTGRTLTILAVRASVAQTSTGASIIVDVNKNGTTIFGTQSLRPTIAAASNTNKTTGMTVTSWPDGEYLTVDIDQVGSPGTEGGDLTVIVTAQ